MSFGAPGYLLLLILAAGCAAIIGRWVAWRRNARASLGRAARASRRSQAFAVLRPALLLVAIAAIAVAAARPQIGERQVQAEERGGDVVVVLDVSQSMLAVDGRPTRLAQAQAEIGSLLERMHGDRTGLVIFAGRPFVRSPLTSDSQTLGELVAGIDDERGLVPPGSDLGGAVRAAQHLVASGQAETKAMIIVSDGEDHGATVSAAVAEARAAGTRIYTAGAGTADGAPVRDVDSVTRQLVDRRDAAGSPVITHLDAAALRQIAEAGNGRYIDLTTGDRPLTALASELESMARTTFRAEDNSQPIERFEVFAAIGLALAAGELLLGGMSSFRLRGAPVRRLWPLAGAGLFIGAICSGGVASVNRAGNRLYERGDYDGALDKYRSAQSLAPSHNELYYNAGNAYDRTGAYDRAVEETKRALPATDELAAKVEYAIGNHHMGARRLQEALDAYKRALLAVPADADAKHNLEVVSSRLSPTPTPPGPPPLPTENPNGQPASPTGNGSGTPGPEGTGTPGAGSGEGTPGAGNGSGNPTDDPRRLSNEQLQQALSQALSGIDRNFSVDEAMQALDLLDQENRRQTQPAGGRGTGLPDY